MTCVHHGLAVFPREFQFLAGFVMVAAPFLTSYRLNLVLVRATQTHRTLAAYDS